MAAIMFSLTGKVALVTGAGRGIGKAIATQLAGAGARVIVNDFDAMEGVDLPGDVTNPEFAEFLINETIRRTGGLDIIVNNAGYTWDSVVWKTTDEQFQAMLEIHLVAPFRILRAAATFLRDASKRELAAGERKHRKVVNITSISGTDG